MKESKLFQVELPREFLPALLVSLLFMLLVVPLFEHNQGGSAWMNAGLTGLR